MTPAPSCPPRPAWWPENEGWPPFRPFPRRSRRGRFFRRVALLAFVLMLLGGAALWALAWLAATALGIVAPSHSSAGPLLFAAGILAIVALMLLATLLRRVGVP